MCVCVYMTTVFAGIGPRTTDVGGVMLRIDKEKLKARLVRILWFDLLVQKEGYVDALVHEFPELKDYIQKKASRLQPDVNGGCQLFITLEKYDDTGEQFTIEIAIAGGADPVESPDHIHNASPDADYAEEYGTLFGQIDDKDDNGVPFVHHRGKPPVRHGPETRHRPIIRDVWVGWFYQPAGSRSA